MNTTEIIDAKVHIDDECIFAAALCALPKMTPKRLKQLLANSLPSSVWNDVRNEAPGADHVERTAKKMQSANMGATFIGHHLYPQLLLDDVTSPAVLFWQGSLAVLNQRRIGIVGTRAATAAASKAECRYGKNCRHNLKVGLHLSPCESGLLGLTIVPKRG